MKKILLAGMIGNIVEFYDFALYGFLAPFIALAFFPADNEIISLILTFSVFFLGFLARPLGALIFGYIGDNRGRKYALSLSLFIMALSTVLIGLLPTYQQWGIFAPITLTFLRLIQGLCLAGEFSGSLVFVLEHNTNFKKGLIGAIVTAAGLLGWLLGAGICSISTSITFFEEVWRIPFFLGALTALVGYYIRTFTHETLITDLAQRNKFISKYPITTLLKYYNKNLLSVTGIAGLIGVLFYGQYIFLNSFLPKIVSITPAMALGYSTLGIALYMFFLPIFGWLSDITGYHKLMATSAISTAILAYPIFVLLTEGSNINIVLSEVIASLLIASFMAPASVIITEMFPAHLRYTGVSVSYNVGMSVIGGVTPLIYGILIKETQSNLSPAIYLSIAGLIGLIATLSSRKILDELMITQHEGETVI